MTLLAHFLRLLLLGNDKKYSIGMALGALLASLGLFGLLYSAIQFLTPFYGPALSSAICSLVACALGGVILWGSARFRPDPFKSMMSALTPILKINPAHFMQKKASAHVKSIVPIFLLLGFYLAYLISKHRAR